ncbi:hypothetical protein BgiMline_024192 [Biomphalaria glabrata]|nr:hypothetical protein BgiMline_007395 [Biomphalaria glabrata]
MPEHLFDIHQGDGQHQGRPLQSHLQEVKASIMTFIRALVSTKGAGQHQGRGPLQSHLQVRASIMTFIRALISTKVEDHCRVISKLEHLL